LPAAVATVAILSGACDRDARLAGQKLRDPKVGTVTHYDVTLDQNASPEQVVYVLLRAMRDDFLAKTDADREKALDTQFDVSAAGFLEVGHGNGIDRLETLYRIVHLWTPTVSHYVNDIETDWSKAQARFKKVGPTAIPNRTDGAQKCQVITQLADPSGDPNANVLLAINLVQDNGYWRVVTVSFIERARSLRPPPKAASD